MIFTFETKVFKRLTGRRCRNIRKHILSVLRLPSYMSICYDKFHYTYPMLLKLRYRRLFRFYNNVVREYFRSRFFLSSKIG